MESQHELLLGYWKRKYSDDIYLFFARACVIIMDGEEFVFKALIREGNLLLDGQAFKIVEISPTSFTLMEREQLIECESTPPPNGYYN